MRIAAIDIGTNSIHMVIASAVRHTEFEVVDREREVVQIGRGSFGSLRLRADSIRRTSEALGRFVQLARRHGVDRILCTTTAAVREASNGGVFLEAARAAAGVTPRVIPAAEEGRLIYLAVRSALRLPEKPVLVVDIGGGSAQLVLGDREKCRQVISVPLGALRLTEAWLESDPPSPRELERLRRHVRKKLRPALRALETRPSRLYGSSGAIHALALASHWLEDGAEIPQLNGHVFTADALDRLIERLEHMTLAQRERLPGLDSKRAEILLPGAIVLAEVMERTDAPAITLSDYGLREGLVTDWLLKHAREVTTIGRGDDLRLRSALGLLARFGTDSTHPEHVAALSLALFDGLEREHELSAKARDLLHVAALLHDVGAAIGYDGHGRHSYYVIKNGSLRGLSAEEVEIVANVARYHGKGRPRKRDESYAELPKRDRRTVQWLAAILRVAEGLDRSHYQLVRSLRVRRRGDVVAIAVQTTRDAQLELWAGRRRTSELARLLGADVRVVPDPKSAKRPASEASPRSRGSVAARPDARLRARRSAATTRTPATPDRSPSSEPPAPRAGRAAPRDRGSRPASAAARAARETEH